MASTAKPKNHGDPAIGGVVINYSGGNQTVSRGRSIYVQTAGNLKVDMANGDTVTFTGLLAGVVYPFSVKKIYQTGTTIAGVVLK